LGLGSAFSQRRTHENFQTPRDITSETGRRKNIGMGGAWPNGTTSGLVLPIPSQAANSFLIAGTSTGWLIWAWRMLSAVGNAFDPAQRIMASSQQ
jgi:hypothetical protein